MVNQHSQHLCIYSNPTHVGKYVMRVTARHFRVPSTLMPQLFTTKATTFTHAQILGICKLAVMVLGTFHIALDQMQWHRRKMRDLQLISNTACLVFG